MKKCTMLAIRKMVMTSKQFIKRLTSYFKTMFKSLEIDLRPIFNSAYYKCTIKDMKSDGRTYSEEELLDLRYVMNHLNVDGFIYTLKRLSDNSIVITPSEKYKKMVCIWISSHRKETIKKNVKTEYEKTIYEVVDLYFTDNI